MLEPVEKMRGAKDREPRARTPQLLLTGGEVWKQAHFIQLVVGGGFLWTRRWVGRSETVATASDPAPGDVSHSISPAVSRVTSVMGAGPLPVVAPSTDCVAHRSQCPQDCSDDEQNDPDGPQNGDVGDEADDQQDDTADDHLLPRSHSVIPLSSLFPS